MPDGWNADDRYRMRLAAAFAVALVACGGSPTAPVTVPGTYVATSVNGGSFPVPVVNTGAQVWSVLSATLTLAADGSWTLVYPMQGTVQGGQAVMADPTPTDVGTYTVSGAVVTFHDVTAGSSPFTGTVSGAQLSIGVGLVNSFAFRTMILSRE